MKTKILSILQKSNYSNMTALQIIWFCSYFKYISKYLWNNDQRLKPWKLWLCSVLRLQLENIRELLKKKKKTFMFYYIMPYGYHLFILLSGLIIFVFPSFLFLSYVKCGFFSDIKHRINLSKPNKTRVCLIIIYNVYLTVPVIRVVL
jgi:hypothetical protein